MRLAPVTGAFERLVALLFRKAVLIDSIAATRSDTAWDVTAAVRVPAARTAHVVASIEREPWVVAVGLGAPTGTDMTATTGRAVSEEETQRP